MAGSFVRAGLRFWRRLIKIMKISVNTILKNTFVGKTLVGLEFGLNEVGCQSATVPQKITGIRVGMDDCREDAVIWLSLENGEMVHAYYLEEIEIED